jgi:hypothetical protein
MTLRKYQTGRRVGLIVADETQTDKDHQGKKPQGQQVCFKSFSVKHEIHPSRTQQTSSNQWSKTKAGTENSAQPLSKQRTQSAAVAGILAAFGEPILFSESGSRAATDRSEDQPE